MRRQEGFALVTSLLVLVVLTILSISGMQVAMSGSSAATHSQDQMAAQSLADSGVNLAVNQLTSTGGVAGGTQPVDNGTASWSGAVGTQGWVLTGTGEVHGVTATAQATITAGNLIWQSGG
jgi:Tfp pilus assembly protein PilX